MILYVLYCDSKFMKFLMDSFGGRFLTFMIVCCFVNERYVEEIICMF